MSDFWPSLPKDEALYLFLLCLGVGAFVVFMYCLDQFDKSTLPRDGNDPWNFFPPPYLTPRSQYLVGFFFYCGTMILIFLAISIVGPERILKIVKGTGIRTSEVGQGLQDFATFP